ncbi:centromere protein J-like [Portunus trituberculatus]|uniref:Centromere protein J n=1 Tax=Portunus trituberculatus TaxID=210409 RepID=A0A5B7DUU0_PORTR|nr:centromere protein J-like [Portunus trituberculatus]MPC24819.1 Centromere protein J [Portunus trituberculatus]
MASQGDAVAASVTLEATEQDLEKPSPSQSLLQRLKSLREWQERQREELMQVLAHSMPPKGSFLTPLKEETPAQLSESAVIDHSTPLHSMPHRMEDSHTTVELPRAEAASPIILTPHHSPVQSPRNFPEKVQVQPRQLADKQSLDELDHMVAVTRSSHSTQTQQSSEWQASPPTLTGHSVVCNTSDPEHSDLEGDERSMTETLIPTGAQERIEDSASLSPQDTNEYINESMEDLFGLEKQKPYSSEKYKSPAPNKECTSKGTTHSSELVRNFAPSKSFFSTMSQQPEGGAAEETPRPRHKFLRKGQGTSRFGLKPMRLKNMSKKEPAAESNLPPDAAMQNNADLPHTTSPPVLTPTKRHFRLPMQTLKLQEVLQVSPPERERLNGTDEPVHGPVQHRASLAVAPTQPLAQHLTTNPPGPRDVEKQQRKEEEELSAFEKLEELAEDSSFSSNSSTVWHLLKQGQQSASSTPLRTPPPLAFQETPVVGSLGMQSKNLGAKSPFLVRNFTNSMVPATSDPFSQQQPVAVDVREVLAQLKSIVRLEGHSISDVTESDIQTLLEGCSSQQLCDAAHSTSTPALPNPLPPFQTGLHHVHFASQGVQVMEYELSDSEGEDTLTEAASLDSDLITTSDLEALTQMSVRGAPDTPYRQQQTKPFKANKNEGDSFSSSEVPLSEQVTTPGREAVVLTYSPPPPRPAQSASNYIWSIFGKERDARKQSVLKVAPKKVKKKCHQQPLTPEETQKSVASAAHPDPDVEARQELEVHKTLLLAKVAELEKETNLFKKENSQLKKLQQQVQEERQKLEEEKCRLDKETATERRKFQEYVDRERNALWREKQQVLHRPALVTQPQEQVMEVVHLREQIRELREERERKESLHQFAVKKLTDRIKTLENENKKLKEQHKALQDLEKENQDLRLKANQVMAGGKARTATQPPKPSRGRPKPGTRSRTVDGVAKALDKMTKPQPLIVKEPQGSASKASKSREDVVNNNTNTAAKESDEDVLTKQDSNTKAESSQEPAPVLKTIPVTEDLSSAPADSARHVQISLPALASLGCTEEDGLEHTERVRQDGIREVIYANGNRKEIHPNGEVTISFYNGDRKEIHADRTVYVYGSDHTSHTMYSSGKEELVFPNGQQEIRCPDGSSEISFPNGSRKSVLSDGTEICTTRDGSVVRTNPDGSQVFEFPSGQREVHRGGVKRREYPDGTVKILHPDGRTETRYSSGRTRIKDREGNVVLDIHTSLSSPLSS